MVAASFGPYNPIMSERASLPVNLLDDTERSRVRALIIIRGVFLILLVTVVMLSLLRGGSGSADDETTHIFVQYWWVPLLVALFLGSAAITVDALTPHKKLSGMTGALFGLIAGLLATVALSWIIELLLEAHDIKFDPGTAGSRVLVAIKAAFGITLCYLGVSVVYSTQDEFRLIIPYVEFSKQLRGTRPLILDTSAIIDGRIYDIGATGFLLAPIIIPRFVIEELQTLSDSGDKLKRNRGRRGLDMVRKMQNSPHVDLSIVDVPVPGMGVDQMLLEAAREYRAHLVTTDFNLNKVAAIDDVKVLNINDLANALRTAAVPGERMTIHIIKRGENRNQGVGYLDDGTMVVVDNAADCIGQRIECSVKSSLQTSAGRMIFGDRIGEGVVVEAEEPEPHTDGGGPAVAAAATATETEATASREPDGWAGGPADRGPLHAEQPERRIEAPLRRTSGPTGRNPRRG